MLRHAWAIAVVLAAGPLLAQAPTSDQLRPAELKPIYDRLEQIDQTMKKLDEKLTRLVEANASASQKEVNELRDVVIALRRELADMTQKAAKEPSVSRKPNDVANGGVAGNGKLVFTNEHPMYLMDIVVNGMRYQVAPGGNQEVAVPAGPVSYQVLTTDPMPRARTIAAGEIRIVTMR